MTPKALSREELQEELQSIKDNIFTIKCLIIFMFAMILVLPKIINHLN